MKNETLTLRRASNGAPVSLVEELGSGGEGAVYTVANAPELVAKIYFEPPETHKVAKLCAMTRLAPAELLRIAAWPVDLLNDETGATRGFLMQRVRSREDAHELYSPKSRRRAFPDADFRFIVHAAANVARAFAQLHALGHVIGDVNHGNALIGRDSTVMLIDCDSFQVKDGDVSFTCDVGVPLFTPPELQGQNFRGLVRSADHDAFGLAVLLFHFLYAGRHPYAGRFADDEMPIEQAIAESRFAYGSNAAARKMSAPPGTLALEAFGAPIAAMFDRAFSVTEAVARPTAVEWVEALHALESELITCLAHSDHDHPKGTACCWCELEDRASIVLFGRFALRGVRLDRAEIERLWIDIKSVELPYDLNLANSQLAQALVIKTMGRGSWRWVWWLFYLVLVWISGEIVSGEAEAVWFALACFGGAVLIAVTSISARSAKRQRETLLREARMRLSDAAFVSTLAHLENARQRLLEIHDTPWLVAPRLGAERRARQREERLRTLMLTDESAPILSESERASLAAIGIESAADVLRERRQLHHWLSYAMVREIIQWADNFRAQVAVEAHAPLEPHELREADEELRSVATRLLADLRSGAASLQGARDVIVTARRDAAEEISSWAP